MASGATALGSVSLLPPVCDATSYHLLFTVLKGDFMEKQTYAVGDRVEKLCAVCGEERGHVVASITKRGLVSRVSCPICGTRSSYKVAVGASPARC